VELIGVITVADYRTFESWRRARFAVCSVLDLARSLSRVESHRRMAGEIDTLSVSILDNMVKGFEKNEGDEYFDKALASVDRLDGALQRIAEHVPPARTAARRLQKILTTVRSTIQHTPRSGEPNAIIRRKK
jgi:hypothetical protein